MNNHLAPTYQRMFGKEWVLWYSTSNNYSVIDNAFKSALDLYFKAKSKDDFSRFLISNDIFLDTQTVCNQLDSYVKNCNSTNQPLENKNIRLNLEFRNLTLHYYINGKYITLHFDAELVKKIIHPSIAHFEINDIDIPDIVYDIHINDNNMFLYKNEKLIIKVPKQDYHKLQGKFIFHLINSIHNKKEKDWIGTFHGSTIGDGKNSILFIGKSGKGKSTLSAILATKGFELVADDVSAMHSDNCHIYYNPLGISIKKGAFNTLQPLIQNFDKIPKTILNPSKGELRYISFNNSKLTNYPCKAVVIVNYNENSNTKLEPIGIKLLLETLVPESWLSPNPQHASKFLDWLKQTPCYNLTYSNVDSVTKTITKLFKELKAK